jgi:site-specific DNA-methyltransferase (adenine-specific)
MRPYYESDGIVLYHGDCREVLPQLQRDRFDLILADPNYGETKLAWDVRDLRWLDLAEPTLRESGSMWCFGTLRLFMAQASALLATWNLAQDVIWEKHNGSNFVDDRFKRVHEQPAHFYRRRTPWEVIYKKPVTTPDATARQVRRKRRPPHLGSIGEAHYIAHDGGPRLARSVLYVRSCHGYADHPCQKPLGILCPLIEYSCPPGGELIDPTCGSGSALVAAKQMGRRAVGIEICEADCEKAARRLTQALPLGATA